LLPALDPHKIPQHIAIIMDGNGRWARKRGMPRLFGHRAGLESVRETVRTCKEVGVGTLTLYAFSSENWSRPSLEVRGLMRLLQEFLRKEIDELHENGVQLRAIGRIEALPSAAKKELARAIELTARNRKLVLNLALNYGGRQEIVDACNRAVREHRGPIDEKSLGACLYTAGSPDPDLLIRTSGEMRISNFLLWQLAYTELYVTDVLWPEFRKPHLYAAIADYQRRHRRFGGL
jgi:undecaprenyl diphosphate synthase